jgi:lysophospholipase L1-like esterase
MPPWLRAAACLLAAATPPADDPASPPDRIVLLGDALLEGDYALGHIETALTAASPDRPLTVRNLGWTGDTVRGDSRAGFETAKEGFERRAKLVAELKPTHILVAYGMNESFAGAAGLAEFEAGLNALLDSIAPTGATITLVAPIAHENLGPPLPDPNAHNADLARYRDAIRRVAQARGHALADLADAGLGSHADDHDPDTTDGIHLDDSGYRRAAAALVATLHPDAARGWLVALDARGAATTPSIGTALSDPSADDRGLRFRALDARLPIPGIPRTLRVAGLPPGTYALTIDGREVARAPHAAWAAGLALDAGPELDQADALRRAIVAKNRLLFHRLRPQNETYLFGFRKHEQGRNAREIPEFDPLVADREAEIDRLKRPVPHTYELTRVEDAK